jgi:ketosteroid isomerase-like protein
MSESARPGGGMAAVIAAAAGGLVLGLLLAAGSAPGEPQMQGAFNEAEEREAIRAALAEQDAAWNAGDLDRFMRTYWADDALTFYSGGDVMKGHRAVHERYRKRYQAEGKEMGKLTFSDLEVTLQAADRAVARGRWKVEMKEEAVGGLFTLVLRKFADGWKIVHDHTSQPEKKG